LILNAKSASKLRLYYTFYRKFDVVEERIEGERFGFARYFEWSCEKAMMEVI